MATCNQCGCEVNDWKLHKKFHDTLQINKKLKETMLTGGLSKKPDNIVSLVSKVFNVSEYEITNSKMRPKRVVEARYVVSYILRHRYKFSYPRISYILGNDHTTVMNILSKDRGCDTEIKTVNELLDEFEGLTWKETIRN